MSRAKALVFAAEEDFGIVPVEAQAAGTPVIAYGKGGALETVIENETGIFFDEQTPEAILAAVQRFENIEFDPARIQKNAEKYSLDRFNREFESFVKSKWEEFNENRHISRR